MSHFGFLFLDCKRIKEEIILSMIKKNSMFENGLKNEERSKYDVSINSTNLSFHLVMNQIPIFFHPRRFNF